MRWMNEYMTTKEERKGIYLSSSHRISANITAQLISCKQFLGSDRPQYGNLFRAVKGTG